MDPPARNAAVISTYALPFPILSDPDRGGLIGPLGVADPDDPRGIARPAVVVFAPDGREVYRHVGRDFLDRAAETDVIAAVRSLELPATTQPAPTIGPAEPGPAAVPPRILPAYYRGARAAVAGLAVRYETVRSDAASIVAMLDRYLEAVRDLRREQPS